MEEKKEYSVIGTVTIGTDEYRDLIEQKLSADKTMEYYRNKYWEEERKVKELSKQVEVLNEKINKCDKLLAKYKKPSDNDEQEDNTITLLMHIFGEE